MGDACVIRETLHHYLTIQRDVSTSKGTTGQHIPNWTDLLANVPAAIEPLSGGRKTEIARQLVPTASHHVTMRFTDITQKDRLNYNGRIFNIGNLQNIEEKNLKLVLTCVEEVKP